MHRVACDMCAVDVLLGVVHRGGALRRHCGWRVHVLRVRRLDGISHTATPLPSALHPTHSPRRPIEGSIRIY